MSIASEITRINNNISNAYTKAQAKGATLPLTQNSDNLADTIDTITGGTASLQSKTVSPTTSQQTVTPDSGYDGLSDVTVNAVTSSIDNNITAGNIKNGVTILGVSGSTSVVDTSDADALAEHMKIGTTAYVNGEKITGTAYGDSVLGIDSSDDITVTAYSTGTHRNKVLIKGYHTYQMPTYYSTNKTLFSNIYVPNATMASAIGLTANKIKSGETIIGVEGEVVELNGETKTVTPTTSQQTIVPTGTGKNALTEVTVNAVTSSIDNNITAGNIKKNVEILGVTGTYEPSLQTKSISITQNGSQTVTADSGYDGLDEVNITTNVTGSSNITTVPNDSPTGSGSNVKTRIALWITEISNLDVGNETNLSFMFVNCNHLTSVSFLDTGNVTLANNMFANCSNLTSVSLFDTSKVSNMTSMFINCSNLTTVPNFDASNVTTMNFMFQYCSYLTNVPAFNTSNKLTLTNSMFRSCDSLVTVPLFNTSQVTNMNYMFSSCYALANVPIFNTSSNTDFNNMFSNCNSLTDTSLDNILQMCINATSYSGTKKLTTLGISNTTIYPASRIQALTHYQDFINAGWTIS